LTRHHGPTCQYNGSTLIIAVNYVVWKGTSLMRSRAFLRWIWLSSVLAVTQARANLHYSCVRSTLTITQSATSGIATVTHTAPNTVYVSIHPSTAGRAIFSSRVTAASNSSMAVVLTIAPIAPVYGSVVDYNDTKPIYNRQPGTLPNRTEGPINVTGVYTLPWPGSLGGSNLLVSLCTLSVLDCS
jgi:hypothetical protein